MELDDRVIVVTGGGSGIGAALATRFAAESPRALVLADIDGAHAASVADGIRREHPALAVEHLACDVSVEAEVAALVADTAARHGRVDLFCANAGIGTGLGIDADDDAWQRIWSVNVMAHVYAARALLPAWLERGEGHLLVTASAAGLLSNLGDAPYSVTKHGAVALAEWLAITYGDRGIHVACLCPQGVRTPLLFGQGTDLDGSLAAEVVKAQRILEPDEVAEVTVAGLRDERFLILPHAEVADYERARAGDRDRWLGAMRRMQAKLTGG
jgi:NAD(P)-dependent dehydrogenase (short-subunit alcohol dehydrogenase family)